MALRVVIFFAMLLIPAELLAQGLSKAERDELYDTVERMCEDASSVAEYFEVEGEAEAGVIIRSIGGGLSGKVKKEEYRNIEQKFNEFRTNPVICRFEMIDRLTPLFGGSSRDQSFERERYRQFALNSRSFTYAAPQGIAPILVHYRSRETNNFYHWINICNLREDAIAGFDVKIYFESMDYYFPTKGQMENGYEVIEGQYFYRSKTYGSRGKFTPTKRINCRGEESDCGFETSIVNLPPTSWYGFNLITKDKLNEIVISIEDESGIIARHQLSTESSSQEVEFDDDGSWANVGRLASAPSPIIDRIHCACIPHGVMPAKCFS